MKIFCVTAVTFLAVVFLTFATAPISVHPPAPIISAAKAIELAGKFLGAETNAARYCSAISLDEGGMTPAPTGSPRHWCLVFQDAGDERNYVHRVYVDMAGQVTETIPINKNETMIQSQQPTIFQTVVIRSNTIIATLPANGRWLVADGSGKTRLSESGESFSLRAGSSLRLTEHHSSYVVTPQFSSLAGLRIESTFDASSFGGKITNRTFFIPAQ
jgi:hypothetical protein